MATVPLAPEAKEDIETGDLIAAVAKEDVTTGSLIVAESIVGLEPLGV